MNRKRILIITQEMKPYLVLSEMARITNHLPVHLLNQGMEIRVLMPRFGSINERRHRLHEVVRLSGMNIIIDDDDFPLIIKVASLPGARLQVYFLDNEDFFKRKYDFTDEHQKFYDDNAERMIFFCKGALETVKKWGWPPDIIHCHGWMTSLVRRMSSVREWSNSGSHWLQEDMSQVRRVVKGMTLEVKDARLPGLLISFVGATWQVRLCSPTNRM